MILGRMLIKISKTLLNGENADISIDPEPEECEAYLKGTTTYDCPSTVLHLKSAPFA